MIGISFIILIAYIAKKNQHIAGGISMIDEILFSDISSVYSGKVGIEIRTKEDMSENDKKLVQKAEFDVEIPVEAWCALGTNQQQAYATHGLFRYFGKFPPSIATYLITKYTREDDLVIDPMCGSGSTAVECLLLKRQCVVNDINPLSVMITNAKINRLDKEKLLAVFGIIEDKYKPLTYEQYKFSPKDCNYEHWFLSETCDSLRGIKKCIEEIEDADIQNFYQVIFASIIRRVSKATTQQGRLFLDVETAVGDAFPYFKKKALKEIENVSLLPEMEKNQINVCNSDLREETIEQYENSAQLVILHPPYFNSYKYSSINCLESGWLEIDRKEVRPKEIREFFKVGKPEKYKEYVDDMEAALRQSLSLLKKDGVLALMIGDTAIRGEYIPVTNTLINRIDSKQYMVEKIAVRVPKYTEASWVASQRRKKNDIGVTLNDFIVIFRMR